MDFAKQVLRWHETYCRDLQWRRFILIVLCIKLKIWLITLLQRWLRLHSKYPRERLFYRTICKGVLSRAL